MFVCRKRKPNWLVEKPNHICWQENGDINYYCQNIEAISNLIKLTEKHWNEALANLIGKAPLLKETKMYVSFGISRLLSLPPSKIRGINKMISTELQVLKRMHATWIKTDPPELEEFLKEYPGKELLLQGLESEHITIEPIHGFAQGLLARNLPKIGLILFQNEWIIIENKSNTPFITSDNPAIHLPHQQAEKIIYIPLTPNFAVFIFQNPSTFAKRQKHIDKVFEKIEQNKILIEEFIKNLQNNNYPSIEMKASNDNNFIMNLNKNIILNAEDIVVSSTESEEIKKMVEKYCNYHETINSYIFNKQSETFIYNQKIFEKK